MHKIGTVFKLNNTAAYFFKNSYCNQAAMYRTRTFSERPPPPRGVSEHDVLLGKNVKKGILVNGEDVNDKGRERIRETQKIPRKSNTCKGEKLR
jgi:hypothetical protein